jgi:hypothetical protein
MLGEIKNQFSLTRAALSRCGQAKSKSVTAKLLQPDWAAGRKRPLRATYCLIKLM